MNTPRISLCMIVRNEEDRIKTCLDSVQQWADEIIIVDTGSTDDTIAICQDYNATILSFQWKRHFAEARNHGLQHATGDWILWLDADEKLAFTPDKQMKTQLAATKQHVFLLPVLHYKNAYQKGPIFIYHQPRVFRNHLGIQFINRIHETPQLPADIQQTGFDYLELPIHHYGYTQEVETEKKKAERNRTLIEEALQETPEDPWLLYHLASEQYRVQDYMKAFSTVNQAIVAFLLAGHIPPSLVYRLKYAILLESGNPQSALDSIDKAIALYPDYVDLQYCKARLLFEKGNYADALPVFQTCLKLGETNRDHLIQQGTGSFLAEKYIDKCLQRLSSVHNNKEET